MTTGTGTGRLAISILSAVILAAGVSTGALAACVQPRDDLVVVQSTTFCPGTYKTADRAGDGLIIVGADDVILDGSGVTLNGRNGVGTGILLRGHRNVTIRNFTITRFYHAIRVEAADAARIEGNRVSSNAGSGEQFYDINRSLSAPYGGGILLDQTTNSVLDGNLGSDQNVGLDMYRSTGNQIVGNDFSDSFGWGIRLYASSSNSVLSNRADHVHGCRGSNCSARDTAGILLVFGSHANTIAGNSFVNGGDGFFIGNENGLPSNGNLVEDNDCSLAVHNAIEATFSQDNVFRGNLASGSAFGFWLGFSHDSRVEDNVVRSNRADGIRWEHGRFGTISGNEIAANAGAGLAFTLNPSNPLIARYPGSEASHDHVVADNTITDNGAAGLRFQNTTASLVQANVIAGNAVNLLFEGASSPNDATDNDLLCRSATGRVCQLAARNDMAPGNDVDAEGNWWGTDVEAQIDLLVLDGGDEPTRGLIDYDPWRGCGDGVCSTGESACACPQDCVAPALESLCADGLDDDCDGRTDCADSDCASSCSVCRQSGASCAANADCCSGRCKGHVCR